MKRWLFGILLVLGCLYAGSTDAAVSFATRCAAAGVFICEGFNTPGDRGFNVEGSACPGSSNFCRTTQGSLNDYGSYTFMSNCCSGANQGVNHPVITNTQMTEGAGAMRIAFPSNAACPGDSMSGCDGLWALPLGKNFHPPGSGDGAEWYWQYKIRYDSYVLTQNYGLTGNPGPAVKQHDWFDSTYSSCAPVEITSSMVYGSTIYQYTGCGPYLTPNHDGSGNSVSPGDYQNGGAYTCSAYLTPAGTCFQFSGDTWYVYAGHVKLGAYGTQTSTVEIWVAPEGQPLQYLLHVTDWPFQANPSGGSNYNTLYLENYITGAPNNGLPSQTGYVYYDELIVSTQPIADPAGGGGTPPAAPTNLRVQ
ncbi:MAG TPA: hypothetical protein VEI50_11035 [Nitrospiraceae bacterium]|nr:hypothetical protein [Nitrospiraceae bacterium]